MIELVCIACPNSCVLKVENAEKEIKVDGNKCKRGIDFAKDELNNPKRSVSTTIRTVFKEIPVVPVRTNGEIPKQKILPLMKHLKDVVIDKILQTGDVVVKDYDNTGVDIIVTTDMNKLL